MALIGVAGLVASVVTEDRAQVFYAVNGAALLMAAGLYSLLDRQAPSRPLGLVRIAILLQYFGGAMLILANLIGGDLQYLTEDGVHSYAVGAGGVVGANLLFTLALYAPAYLFGPRGRPREEVAPLEALSAGVLRSMVLVAAVSLVFRLVLLFLPPDTLLVPAYFLRLFVGLFLPTAFFIGVALRRRTKAGRVLAVFVLAVGMVTVLAGSRWDALMLLIIVFSGFVLARPIGGLKLVSMGLIGVLTAIVALLVGQGLREDGLGRTGQAALERLEGIGERVAGSEATKSPVEATLGRLISTSTHAVLTRVPDELPFEDGGLTSLPESLLASFLPRFNWDGVSREETPRTWLLTRLGFTVNWQTSVEFTLLADAWYRAGWLGLIVVGFLAGTLLQWSENFGYRASIRRPEAVLVLLSVVVFLPSFMGRDIVASARGLAFCLGATLMLLFVVRLPPGEQRARSLR